MRSKRMAIAAAVGVVMLGIGDASRVAAQQAAGRGGFEI